MKETRQILSFKARHWTLPSRPQKCDFSGQRIETQSTLSNHTALRREMHLPSLWQLHYRWQQFWTNLPFKGVHSMNPFSANLVRKYKQPDKNPYATFVLKPHRHVWTQSPQVPNKTSFIPSPTGIKGDCQALSQLSLSNLSWSNNSGTKTKPSQSGWTTPYQPSQSDKETAFSTLVEVSAKTVILFLSPLSRLAQYLGSLSTLSL